MIHEELLHRCFRCGYCKMPSNYVEINCPAYLAFRFETFSPGGRMWLLRAWREGQIPASRRLAEIMFSCAACGNCTEHCVLPELKGHLLDLFAAGKEALLDAGRVPGTVRDFLTTLQLHGNPYRMPAKKRAEWARGAGVDAYDGQEYLLFVDDVSAFDPRGREIAGRVAALLQSAGVSFGIQPQAGVSDANDANAMGERALFKEFARRNIEAFDEMGVQKIVTLSPHSLNALINEYPALGGRYQVHHYTQVLAFAMGSLRFASMPPRRRVTFHDPCYLARHNGDGESARMVLRAVPGVELAEMDRQRKNALCCGGGGGNFFTNLLSAGSVSPSRIRVRDALETGADILAVACPQCAVMLGEALKSENLEGRLQVMDISEIVSGVLAVNPWGGFHGSFPE